MRVSVVINTLNRAEPLRDALLALEYLDNEDVEVVVVNGPSTDATEEVIAAYAGRVKAGRCPEANLSMSRNIGIALAAGEVVAFLDDDAYPDPAWLDRIVEGYDDEEVAAVGGPVLDHTGTRLQVRYLRSDRYGATRREAGGGINPSYAFSVPGATHFPSILGANSSFRRSLLTAIGGFDEEYEYFLDETDVCVRLLDRGYVVRMLEDGFVYHKFLPSSIRSDNRVARNRYSVIKNATYFALRHALPLWGFAAVCRGVSEFVEGNRAEMQAHVAAGTLTPSDLARFEEDVERASTDGLRHSLGAPRTRAPRFFEDPPPFLPWRRRRPAGRRLHVALVTREHPPGPVNGIGRLFAAEAAALAARGHVVHVVTAGAGHDTVDFEQGVWVHRPVPGAGSAPAGVPQHIWAWAETARREVAAIDGRRRLDVVVVPIWDSEGYALIGSSPCPVVLGVYTPLSTVLRLDPHIAAGDAGMLAQLMEAERRCVEQADYILASGPWTIEEVERGHGTRIAESRRLYAMHGLPDLTAGVDPERPDGDLHLLFVGRVEPRKGVDVLFDCLPDLLRRFPQLVVTVAGEDVAGLGARFAASLDPGTARRVRMPGRVDDERLRRLYAGCDVFVAPSRYESFGLVLVEAMMFAKPVVASRVGGMQAIVEDGTSGVLVEPGDARALGDALAELLESPDRRAAMGAAARARFDSALSEGRMAEQLEAALGAAVAGAGARV